MEKRCTEKTTGIVSGLSKYYYADIIKLPTIDYYVDGQPYQVVGPRFSYIVARNMDGFLYTKKTNFHSNLTTKDDLPDFLELNTAYESTENPVLKLFPIGSEVDVFYNPNDPKEAYAIRYVDHVGLSKLSSKQIKYLIFGLGIFVLVISLLLIIGNLAFFIFFKKF
ncbi:MAG: hypothetical protein Q4E36_05460 [Bacillota bacterium]|nr:hypothetical protein [Bacillota bacterium]